MFTIELVGDNRPFITRVSLLRINMTDLTNSDQIDVVRPRTKNFTIACCVVLMQLSVFGPTFASDHEITESTDEYATIQDANVEPTSGEGDLATDDVAYLTQLGLLRGHLAVGLELYRGAMPKMAETHMKHPDAELYADLVPTFKSRGCRAFAGELTELARVVSARNSLEVVTSKYELLGAAIRRCELTAENENPAVVVQVTMNLLRNALFEYEIGVVDGAIANVHEFQDAWGFTQVAEIYARSNAFQSNAESRLIAQRIQRLVGSLELLWPSLNPTSIDDPQVPLLLEQLRSYTNSTAQIR